MKVKPQLYLVAEAGGSQGYGHLFRAKGLAYYLREEFDLHVISSSAVHADVKQAFEATFSCIWLDSFDAFPGMLSAGDLVVLDGYAFDLSLMQAIKKKDAILICWDDYLWSNPLADAIINAAPDVSASDYDIGFATLLLLGASYFPIQEEFWNEYPVRRKEDALLINMGGTDPENLSIPILHLACETATWSAVTVVTGAGYAHVEALKEEIAQSSQKTLIKHVSSASSAEMAELMQAHSYALLPASTVCYEALWSGCKVLCGYFVGNQELYYRGFVNRQWVIPCEDFNEQAVRRAILGRERNLEAFPAKTMASAIQWQKKFKALFLSHKLALRLAAPSDLALTFRWACDPAIRRFSFSNQAISKEEHSRWFAEKLNESDGLFLIAQLDDQIIGSCRFAISQQQAKISYQLDPSFQGQGLGLALLRRSLAYLEVQRPDVMALHGEVMQENVASIRIFEQLGFEKQLNGKGWLFIKQKAKN